MKICNKCKFPYSATLEFFTRRTASKDGLSYTCRSCSRETSKDHYQNNKPEYKRRAKDWAYSNPEKRRTICHTYDSSHTEEAMSYNKKKKLEVLEAYGGPTCVCCFETEIEFLCIDHIDGGGGKHLREIKKAGSTFYRWLKKEGWPIGYRVLCHNCNMATRYNKLCPHQIKRET